MFLRENHSPLDYPPTGTFIEVWGSQAMGGRGSAGNSTYILDGSIASRNIAFQPGNTTSFVKLFSTPSLHSGAHTLTIVNCGVHLTIGYFKVQKIDIGSLAPSSALANIGEALGATSGISSTVSFGSSKASQEGTPWYSCFMPLSNPRLLSSNRKYNHFFGGY